LSLEEIKLIENDVCRRQQLKIRSIEKANRDLYVNRY